MTMFARAAMRTSRILLLSVFAVSLACGIAYAAKRSDKPAQSAASPAQSAATGAGQIVCNVRGCRPVKKGCRIEIVGPVNEEVCN